MSTTVEAKIRTHLQANDAVQETIDWAEIVARLDTDAPLIATPRPSRRYGVWVAIAAAAVTILLFGLIPLLTSDDPPPADTVVATTLVESTPTTVGDSTVSTIAPETAEIPAATLGILGPGSWSVAASFVDPSILELSHVVDEVRTWPGVIEVAEAPDASAWTTLTGLDSDCGTGDVAAPCGPGVVVLTVYSSMDLTASRMSDEFGMVALTPLDVPRQFVDGIVDQAIELASPVSLGFDPSELGDEQPLRGPFRDYEPDNSVCGGPCDVAVEAQIDGWTASVGLALTEFNSTLSLDFASGGYPIDHLLGDQFGRHGVLADLRQTLDGYVVEHEFQGQNRRAYAFAALPLSAAVVTFELADGSSVWQRPLAGMALIVDAPGSEGTDRESAGPFIILDATGAEIMRIQDTPSGPLIEDLRMTAVIAAGRDRSDVAAPPVEMEATQVAAIPGGVSRRSWNNSMAHTDDAVWVAAAKSIVRIDGATLEVTDTVPLAGDSLDVVAVSDAVWSMDRSGTVSRIDGATRRVTHTFEIPKPSGGGFINGGLWVGEGVMWVSHPGGYDRIDLGTLSVDRYPYPERVFLGDDFEGGRLVIGEVDGGLWLVDGPGTPPWLTRIDLSTRVSERFEVDLFARPEAYPTLADDAIWFASCCSGAVVRFDVASKQSTSPLRLAAGLGFGVYSDGAVWVPNHRRNTIARIDTATLQLTDMIDVAAGPLLVAADGAVWVTTGCEECPATTLLRIDPATRRITHRAEYEGHGGSVVALLEFDGAIWLAGQNGEIVRIQTTQ